MAVPPSYAQVTEHLGQIFQDPSTALDIHAIDKLRTELVASTDPKSTAALLVQIVGLLPVLKEDPAPLTSLATKAAEQLDFSQINSIQPPVNFLAGLKAPSPPVNLLALSLLGKASYSASNAAIVAGDQSLVISLVELWLSTSATEVSQAAFDVLWALLEVDHPEPRKDEPVKGAEPNNGGGQGLMWRRVFGDKDVYSLLFWICNEKEVNSPNHLSSRQTTVAQGRLMDLVLKAGALDWNSVAKSQFPDVESNVGSDSLLDFVACHMVDTEDILLHMMLIQFLRDMLGINAPGMLQRRGTPTVPCPQFSSPALEFLLSSGLHDKVMNYYMDQRALDRAVTTYLSGPLMSYVSHYALLYPNHLLQNPQAFLDKLLSRILDALEIPSIRWANGPVPSGELNIIASLPRVMLLEAGKRSLNPLMSIPSKPSHKDSFDALGRIFHGPPHESEVSSGEEAVLEHNLTSPRAEAVAARVLYLQYLNEHPELWVNVVAAADIMAMQDTALAALAFIKTVAMANWEVIDVNTPSEALTNSRFPLPTEDQVSNLGPSTQGMLPKSGAWAILVPPALTTVLPYLFKPPQTHANFVAGGAADKESAVWRIATAKYDALVALHDSVLRVGGKMEGIEEILNTLGSRVADGPLGRVNLAGNRVDALEL